MSDQALPGVAVSPPLNGHGVCRRSTPRPVWHAPARWRSSNQTIAGSSRVGGAGVKGEPIPGTVSRLSRKRSPLCYLNVLQGGQCLPGEPFPPPAIVKRKCNPTSQERHLDVLGRGS